MPDSLVIDTNIILHYINQDEEYFESCEWIIFKIKDHEVKLTLDHQGLIFEEYHRQISMNSEKLPARILMKLIERFRFHIHSNSIFHFVEPIDFKKVDYLEKIGFHSDDLIFVRVAPKSDQKRIISTDFNSFLNPNYKKWILDNLDVSILNPIDFYE